MATARSLHRQPLNLVRFISLFLVPPFIPEMISHNLSRANSIFAPHFPLRGVSTVFVFSPILQAILSFARTEKHCVSSIVVKQDPSSAWQNSLGTAKTIFTKSCTKKYKHLCTTVPKAGNLLTLFTQLNDATFMGSVVRA